MVGCHRQTTKGINEVKKTHNFNIAPFYPTFTGALYAVLILAFAGFWRGEALEHLTFRAGLGMGLGILSQKVLDAARIEVSMQPRPFGARWVYYITLAHSTSLLMFLGFSPVWSGIDLLVPMVGAWGGLGLLVLMDRPKLSEARQVLFNKDLALRNSAGGAALQLGLPMVLVGLSGYILFYRPFELPNGAQVLALLVLAFGLNTSFEYQNRLSWWIDRLTMVGLILGGYLYLSAGV